MARKNPGSTRSEGKQYADKVLAKENNEVGLRNAGSIGAGAAASLSGKAGKESVLHHAIEREYGTGPSMEFYKIWAKQTKGSDNFSDMRMRPKFLHGLMRHKGEQKVYRQVAKGADKAGTAALGATLDTSLAGAIPVSRLKEASKSIEDTYPKIQEAKAKNAELRKRKEK